MECFHCGSDHLRISSFHIHDVPEFLLLRVPIRCRSCSERFYVQVFSAWKHGLVGKASAKHSHARSKADNDSAVA